MSQTAQQLFDRAKSDDAVRAKLNARAYFSETGARCPSEQEIHFAKTSGIGDRLYNPDFTRDLNAAARLKLPVSALVEINFYESARETNKINVINVKWGGTNDQSVVFGDSHEALARLCVWAVATGVEV